MDKRRFLKNIGVITFRLFPIIKWAKEVPDTKANNLRPYYLSPLKCGSSSAVEQRIELLSVEKVPVSLNMIKFIETRISSAGLEG